MQRTPHRGRSPQRRGSPRVVLIGILTLVAFGGFYLFQRNISNEYQRYLASRAARTPTTSPATTSSPASAPSDEIAILVAAGVAALEASALDLAMERFEAALTRDPGHERATLEFVNLLLRLQDNGRALVIATRAAETNPQSAIVQRVHATALDRMGRLPEAEAAFRRALVLRPTDPETCYGLGVTLFRQRKFDESLEHYAAAAKLDSLRANYWNNWGCALLELARYTEAAEKLTRALELDPQDALAWNNLGSALERSGRRPEAIDCYQKAVLLEPAYARAHQRLVQAYMDLGLFTEAVEKLQQAGAVIPGAERLGLANQMGRIRAACPDATLRDPALAVRIAESLVRDTEQKSFEAYDTLAIALAATGDFENAIVAADKAIELAEQYRETAVAADLRARRALFAAGMVYLLPDAAPVTSQPASQLVPRPAAGGG